MTLAWMALLACLTHGQDLKLPAEVRGETSAFITVVAETTGKAVRFFPLDPGLSVFPAALLANPRATVVVGGRPGRYRLLAYTAAGDLPSDPVVCVVVVGDGAPPPSPVEDPLAKSIQSIYGGLQEADKAANVAALAKVYRGADVSSPGTLGELLAAMRRAAAGIPAQALRPIRERLAEHLGTALGEDQGLQLTAELRSMAQVELVRIAGILENLK